VQLLTPDVHRGTLSAIALTFYTGLAAMVGPLLVGLYGDLVFGEGKLGLAMLASTTTLAVVGVPFGVLGRKRFVRAAEAIEAHAARVEPLWPAVEEAQRRGMKLAPSPPWKQI
jgi:hypothetical protein